MPPLFTAATKDVSDFYSCRITSKINKYCYPQSSKSDKYSISPILFYYYCIWGSSWKENPLRGMKYKEILFNSRGFCTLNSWKLKSRWWKYNVCMYTGILFSA